ncbi:hypothetical protein ADIARSV_0550 [Arcticibacter svalbardensis MN12-7]|uniref:Uncharacterized protein n=1 Tax=Arcticibacter svalbardensis MN12-7 TaxID=1150600 RepID=R9GXT5_9SPHI|nr:hypothetical protein [Arcticibacter svalbardensis]EOR96315.1 hypothetical protein ADIARSV_0550 [Arcticibacter svalbardensis MN12-7]
MKKKRAILSTGIFSVNQKRGPIRSASTGSEAHEKAKLDLTRLESHYGSTGMIISDVDTLLWNGDTDSIFEE